jgi:hypothetical protein
MSPNTKGPSTRPASDAHVLQIRVTKEVLNVQWGGTGLFRPPVA